MAEVEELKFNHFNKSVKRETKNIPNDPPIPLPMAPSFRLCGVDSRGLRGRQLICAIWGIKKLMEGDELRVINITAQKLIAESLQS